MWVEGFEEGQDRPLTSEAPGFGLDQILRAWVCPPLVKSVHLKFYFCVVSMGSGIEI